MTPTQVYEADRTNSALLGRFLFQHGEPVDALPAGVSPVKAPAPFRSAFRGWCADRAGVLTHMVSPNGRVWPMTYLGTTSDRFLATNPLTVESALS